MSRAEITMNKAKTRISRAFENNKAFIAFITGGDPDLETTERLIPEMVSAGADLIEIGIPFSDPVAEGIAIQKANKRALDNGCTVDMLFDMVKRVRSKTDIPLLFMTYFNPVFTYGPERFMRRCSECGIDGIIVPDMPFEEKGELAECCSQSGVVLISMIAPTSGERIGMIAKEAEGFIYCVSSLGVTGVRSQLSSDINNMICKAREATDVPCAVGFGVSTPNQARMIAETADGVIVGSAIVEIIERHGKNCIKAVADYIRIMKDSIAEL